MNPGRQNTAGTVTVPSPTSFRRSAFGPPARATLLVLWAAAQIGRAHAQEAQNKETSSLPTVTVTAESQDDSQQHLGAKVSSGALGARSQLETPFSTTVVTSEDMAERQVSKLGDVFALDASVSDNSGAYSSWASYITVRGLPLDWQNAYRINGQPFLSYAITMPYEHFEQIELLKGSSGFMYGFGSPGGIVNYVTKKPTDTPVRSIEVGYKTAGIWSEHVDLGGRFGTDDRFGYRLNATHEEGKTYNDGNIRRDSVSLGLDAKLTDKLTWTFDSLYQKRTSTGQTPSIYLGSYTGTSLPSTISANNASLVGPASTLPPTSGSIRPACNTSYRPTGRSAPATATAAPREAATKASPTCRTPAAATTTTAPTAKKATASTSGRPWPRASCAPATSSTR